MKPTEAAKPWARANWWKNEDSGALYEGDVDAGDDESEGYGERECDVTTLVRRKARASEQGQTAPELCLKSVVGYLSSHSFQVRSIGSSMRISRPR